MAVTARPTNTNMSLSGALGSLFLVTCVVKQQLPAAGGVLPGTTVHSSPLHHGAAGRCVVSGSSDEDVGAEEEKEGGQVPGR